MEEQKQQECTAQTQELLELGASTTKSSRGNIYTLTIIGQIEGHQVLPETVKTTKYEHVIPLLAAVEESEEIDGLLLLLNTVGGDIEAGLAIAELIAGMKKPTVSLVLGGGHSIGIPLAVSAKRAIIAPRASITAPQPVSRRISSYFSRPVTPPFATIRTPGSASRTCRMMP